jgi:hypothetical protein
MNDSTSVQEEQPKQTAAEGQGTNKIAAKIIWNGKKGKSQKELDDNATCEFLSNKFCMNIDVVQ